MKLSHVIATTLAAGVVGVSQATAATLSLSVPPFAFLRYHVDSTQQLAREVSFDTTVQDRFARHFHMAGPAVATFFENDLVLKPLSAAHTFHVYCVTSQGHEYSFIENLPAGTPVFVRKQDGLPVIDQVDGNPLVNNLPPVLRSNSGPVGLARFSQANLNIAKLRTVDIGNGAGPGGSFDDTDQFTYNGQTIDATETTQGIVFTENGQPLFAPIAPPGYFVGAFFTTAALIALVAQNGGGGNNNNPPPVPEPAPIAVLAIGAAGVGILVMRRKQTAKVLS